MTFLSCELIFLNISRLNDVGWDSQVFGSQLISLLRITRKDGGKNSPLSGKQSRCNGRYICRSQLQLTSVTKKLKKKTVIIFHYFQLWNACTNKKNILMRWLVQCYRDNHNIYMLNSTPLVKALFKPSRVFFEQNSLKISNFLL